MIKYSNSTYENIDGIHILNMNEKDSYHTGYAYAKLLILAQHPIIEFLKKKYVRLLSKLTYIVTKNKQKKIIFPEIYKEELRGYADATGIPVEYFLTYNNLFDIVPKFGAHCTTTSFFSNKNYFIARNTDTYPVTKYALKYAQTIVVSIKLPDKNRITHVSVPFLVGAITGWNDKKIAIYSHQISFVKKTQLDKYSTALLVRTALEEISHISQANNILKKYLPNRPVNLMLSDAKTKKHVHIEVHSEELAIAKTNKNYLVVSTFPSLLTKYMKTNNGAEEFVKRSKMRYSSAITYVKDKKTIDVELLITLLKDTRNGTSVKITGNSISNKGTYQSFIFDMIKNILYISNGKTSPASLTGKYVKIKLVD